MSTTSLRMARSASTVGYCTFSTRASAADVEVICELTAMPTVTMTAVMMGRSQMRCLNFMLGNTGAPPNSARPYR